MLPSMSNTALLALLTAATALGSSSHSRSSDGEHRKLPDFSKLLFFDDFTSGGPLPDPSKWKVDLGTRYPNGGPRHWGTGEIQEYTADERNLRITADQTLLITPVRGRPGEGVHGEWTSARIESTP
ncbi:hypothetical protein E4U41_005612, partial [Claviceps citrina]